MRVSRYLKQMASLERALHDGAGDHSTDEYGAYLYDNPVQIKCRKVSETTIVENGDGNEKISRTVYYTDTPVLSGDKLDSLEVLKVSEMVDPMGHVQGYTVYL